MGYRDKCRNNSATMKGKENMFLSSERPDGEFIAINQRRQRKDDADDARVLISEKDCNIYDVRFHPTEEV